MIDTHPWPTRELLSQIRLLYKKENQSDAWPAEKDGVQAALLEFERRLGRDARRYLAEKAVGVGGSGVVIKLKDALFPEAPKALKFPRPVPNQIDMLAELLHKEIRFLSGLRHPGIVAVHYHWELNDVGPYTVLPYLIMDFVNGQSSDRYMAESTTSETDLLRIALETARVIDYLHSWLPRPLVHLDLKDTNVQITDDGRPVVIDLGTCKALTEDPKGTLLACTKLRAHPDLVKLLDRDKDPSDPNRVRGEPRRSDLRKEFDLFSFGLMLLDWMGLDPWGSKLEPAGLYERLSPYARKYLLLLAARLTVVRLPPWLEEDIHLEKLFIEQFPVESSKVLVDLLGRLSRSENPLDAVPELAPWGFSSIQAGPGTHVPLTESLVAVLKHPLFRRLGAVPQLGLVSQVYPGARHTRREHSLGTYANTRKLLRVLFEDPYSPLFRQLIDEGDCRAILLAALLHDIGQFPLAHDLEEIDDSIFSHTELTKSMLAGRWKKGAAEVRFESFGDVFAAWGTQAEDIIRILEAKATRTTAKAKDKLLRSLISGPIDADKLDYLFRDARHTDVTYPLGVDVDRLLRCVTTVLLPRAGQAKNVPCVGVHAKGKVTAEFLLMARYAMFSQVYWHHAVRSQKSMLSRAVQALLASLDKKGELLSFRRELTELVRDLPLSGSRTPASLGPLFEDKQKATDIAPGDLVMLDWFHRKLEDLELPEAELVERIIDRRLFKRLWVVTYEMDKELWRRLMRLWDPLDRGRRYLMSHRIEQEVSREMSGKVKPVTSMDAKDAEGRIETYTTSGVPWLLLDLPGDRVGSEVPLCYVLEGQRRSLRKDDRAVGQVEEAPAWRAYAGRLREAAGKIRVFCHPELVDSVEASVDWATGMERIEGVLTKVPRGEFS